MDGYNTPELRQMMSEMRRKYSITELSDYIGRSQMTLRHINDQVDKKHFYSISQSVAEDVRFAYAQFKKHSGTIPYIDNKSSAVTSKVYDIVSHLVAYMPKIKVAEVLDVSVPTVNHVLSKSMTLSESTNRRIIANGEHVGHDKLQANRHYATAINLPKLAVPEPVGQALYELRDYFLNQSTDKSVFDFLNKFKARRIKALEQQFVVFSDNFNWQDNDLVISVAYFLSHVSFHLESEVES